MKWLVILVAILEEYMVAVYFLNLDHRKPILWIVMQHIGGIRCIQQNDRCIKNGYPATPKDTGVGLPG